MSPAVEAILKLSFLLDEHLDHGRFDDAAAMFADATISVEGTDISLTGSGEVLAFLRDNLRRDPNGTCSAVRCTMNPVVDVDEVAEQATSRAYFTVFQATTSLPLQPVLGGTYADTYRLTEHGWNFVSRTVRVRLRGELSQLVLTTATS